MWATGILAAAWRCKWHTWRCRGTDGTLSREVNYNQWGFYLLVPEGRQTVGKFSSCPKRLLCHVFSDDVPRHWAIFGELVVMLWSHSTCLYLFTHLPFFHLDWDSPGKKLGYMLLTQALVSGHPRLRWSLLNKMQMLSMLILSLFHQLEQLSSE
jgi:hypothetical protein